MEQLTRRIEAQSFHVGSRDICPHILVVTVMYSYSRCLVVGGILSTVCRSGLVVATHGPVTRGGSSASRQPTSGRGHRAMGGSWTRAGHGWKMMLHNIRRRSLLTSALKAKFTIHDVIYVKIAKHYSWWTHAELQLDTFYLILMRNACETFSI